MSPKAAKWQVSTVARHQDHPCSDMAGSRRGYTGGICSTRAPGDSACTHPLHTVTCASAPCCHRFGTTIERVSRLATAPPCGGVAAAGCGQRWAWYGRRGADTARYCRRGLGCYLVSACFHTHSWQMPFSVRNFRVDAGCLGWNAGWQRHCTARAGVSAPRQWRASSLWAASARVPQPSVQRCTVCSGQRLCG